MPTEIDMINIRKKYGLLAIRFSQAKYYECYVTTIFWFCNFKVHKI